MKKTFLVIGLLLTLSFPAIKSLLQPGDFLSHDLTFHIVRQADMDKLLSEGQFPPRWSGDLNKGYGHPLFLFNYPAPAILGEIFYKLGFNLVDSVKAVMTFSILMAVVGMYLFLESLFSNRQMGPFLGAIFYLYAPVTFINLYVSGEVGAVLAMGILPFIFWTIVRASQNKKWAIPLGSMLVALLILSHNVTALMFSPIILTFSLVLIYRSGNRQILFKKLSLMAFLGVGLAAFFWIPALYEKKFIVYDLIMKNFWLHQFPTFGQLIYSPWGHWLSRSATNSGMSRYIGLVHIFIFLILLIAIFVFRKRKEFLTWGIFVVVVFIISAFLMLEVSTPVWENFPLIYLVQFPGRFSAVAVFAISIGVALLIKYLPFNKIIFVVLLSFVLSANWDYLNTKQKIDPGDTYYLTINDTTTAFNEHLPIWAYLPQIPSPGKLEILNGEGNISILENKSVRVVAKINLSTNSKIRFNQFYFPGWVFIIDNKQVKFPYQADSYQDGGESQGLPVFTLTKGSHLFEAEFIDTPDRRFADMVSLLGLICLGFISLKFLFR